MFKMRVFGLMLSGVLASPKVSMISCLNRDKRYRGINVSNRASDSLPHLELFFSHSKKLVMRLKGHMLKGFGGNILNIYIN